MKEFAKDLKTIYTAADEKAALKRLKEVTEKWKGQYPGVMGRWYDKTVERILKLSRPDEIPLYNTQQGGLLKNFLIWIDM